MYLVLPCVLATRTGPVSPIIRVQYLGSTCIGCFVCFDAHKARQISDLSLSQEDQTSRVLGRGGRWHLSTVDQFVPPVSRGVALLSRQDNSAFPWEDERVMNYPDVDTLRSDTLGSVSSFVQLHMVTNATRSEHSKLRTQRPGVIRGPYSWATVGGCRPASVTHAC